MAFKIETITAIIGADENEEEGIWSALSDGVWVPMIGADWDRVKSMVPAAMSMARTTGKKFKVIRFSQMTDITEEVMREYNNKNPKVS